MIVPILLHNLYTGGAIFLYNGYPAYSWYAWNHGTSMSAPWAYAHHLNSFLLKNKDIGPYAWRSSWYKFNSSSDVQLYPGDVILAHTKKTVLPYHSLAVSKEGGKNRMQYCARDNNLKDEYFYNLMKSKPNLHYFGLKVNKRY